MQKRAIKYVMFCGCTLFKKQLKEKLGRGKTPSGNPSRILICPECEEEIDYKLYTCNTCGKEVRIEKKDTSPGDCPDCKVTSPTVKIVPVKGNVRKCIKYHLCTPYCVHPFHCKAFSRKIKRFRSHDYA